MLERGYVLSPRLFMEERLVFPGIADSNYLAVLAKILDDHCEAIGVGKDSPAREAAVYRIVCLFNGGVLGADELKKALAEAGR